MEPFRNDHDAALARADALGVELDLARQELADARTRIDALEQQPRSRTTPAPRPGHPLVIVFGLVMGAIVMVFFGLVFPRCAHRADTVAPEADSVVPAAAPAPVDDPGAELSCPLEEPYVP